MISDWALSEAGSLISERLLLGQGMGTAPGRGKVDGAWVGWRELTPHSNAATLGRAAAFNIPARRASVREPTLGAMSGEATTDDLMLLDLHF
ncbi:hypothetical protein GCM10010844_41300 [Deinococcus radiotolerans]|uniref:Uncharacterized protein n=1 Tax=Deinococcus radiotolerans TaxID=1309407 RepID=A0ABQ2FR25_9DEIO|nr:hypothetical protein GCM10010844_41300 [Deinococcus radiotolerans]